MKLTWELVDGGVVIKEQRLIGSPRSVDQWANQHQPALRLALARLHELANRDDNAVTFREAEVFLSDRSVSQLADNDARALGLPPSCPFALRLESQTHVKSADFRVAARWVRHGGVPVRADQAGPFLKNAGAFYRVPQPLFGIAEKAADLSVELPEDDRLAAYGKLVRSLRTYIDPSINADEYLDRVTVYHAAAFSLRLGVNNDDLDFDPILFGREIVDEAEGGALVDEAEASLLSPRHQDIFASDRFRAYPEARRAYVLEDGSFVVLEPDLLKAMTVVREVASSDSAIRRQFISNPTGFIKAAVGDDVVAAVDNLFIETEQFSDRVTGVDIWRKPVMPWVKPAPETWIPEKFGVQIGDGEPIEIPGNKIEEVLKAYDAAAAAGNDTFSWDGHIVPVSEKTRDAFATLADLQSQITSNEGSEADPGHPAEPSTQPDEDTPEAIKRFLTITENLDVVGYEREFGSGWELASAPEVPPAVKATLKSYQKVGFEWLVRSSAAGVPGVLLADDMGLGKTLQTLAYLSWSRDREPARTPPVLIVAPTGLLANWKAEIEKHLQSQALGAVVDAYGTSLKMMRSDAGKATETGLGQTVLDLSDWKNAGVILTTYETMRDYHFSFAKMPFSTVVFDEVQKLKNPASQMSRAARTLNSSFKIGISGTPVENRLQDLWSIMDVLWPGFLGASKAFEREFPANNSAKLEQLHSIIFEAAKGRPAVGLRRLKASELDGLPAKNEVVLEKAMPADQAKAYAAIVHSAVAARSSMSAGDSMLKTLQDLRSVSLHPDAPATGYADMDAYVAKSARLMASIKTLEEIAKKGEKALVFVESLEMQAFLAEYLWRKFGLSQRPECISGKVPGQKRQQIVDRFQSAPAGFDVLILSPKAGGVGLTITAANHVIHLSRWWNPAVEDQSTDRVFRIGQDKDVSVYLPIAVSPLGTSFDQKLDDLLRKKRSLAGQMLMPPEDRNADASALFGDLMDATGAVETNDTVEAPKATLTVAERSQRESGGFVPRDGVSEARHALVFTYVEGKAPDFEDLFGDLVGVHVERLELIDPYSMWRPAGQAALCRLISEIAQRSSVVRRVQLVFRPPNQVSGREFDTTEKAHHALRSRVALAADRGGFSVPRLGYSERRPTKDRDFHDRFINIQFERDGELFDREYLVSRGLDAFERHEWRVDVTRKPDVTRSLEAA